MPIPSLKIISGGQTGVDRAALDFALDMGIPHGGWCPAGRLAEDGQIADFYELEETKSSRYEVRTRLNVRESDGTLIISDLPLTGGTRLTEKICEQLAKPLLILKPDQESIAATLEQWLKEHRISALNIAGPRESTQPGIYQRSQALLHRCWATTKPHSD